MLAGGILVESYSRLREGAAPPTLSAIPFVVLLLRLEIEAWGYYIAGALLIVSWAVLYMVDGAESARVDAAVDTAKLARQAYESARDEVSPPR